MKEMKEQKVEATILFAREAELINILQKHHLQRSLVATEG